MVLFALSVFGLPIAYLFYKLMEDALRYSGRYKDSRSYWAEYSNYEAQVQRHQTSVQEQRAQELAAYQSAPRWFPIQQPESERRLDVFGGTADGWDALLHTYLMPLAYRGESVTVLDLSARDVTASCRSALGGTARTVTFPEDLVTIDPLSRAARPWDIANALLKPGDEARDVLAMIVRRVLDILGEDATTPRLWAALTFLVAQGTPFAQDLLSPKQRSDLLDPGTTALLRIDGGKHLVRLAAALEPLVSDVIQDVSAGGPAPDRLPVCDSAGITTIGNRQIGDLDQRARVDNFLAAAAASALAEVERRVASALVVAGADRLTRNQIEALITQSSRHRVKLVLLFEHLRDEARELLGRSGSDSLIMQLGNAEDAEAASKFIGKEFRFVVSQVTLTASQSLGGSQGRSIEESRGWSWGKSGKDPNQSLSMGETEENNWSNTTTYGETTAREYEYTAEPTQIQRLPHTQFIFVTAVMGVRHVVAGDCHPAIERSGLVSTVPLALE